MFQRHSRRKYVESLQIISRRLTIVFLKTFSSFHYNKLIMYSSGSNGHQGQTTKPVRKGDNQINRHHTQSAAEGTQVKSTIERSSACPLQQRVAQPQSKPAISQQTLQQLAMQQVNASKQQILLCEQMKLAIHKHFAAFKQFEDTAANILSDFKTPPEELLERAQQDLASAAQSLSQQELQQSMPHLTNQFLEFNRAFKKWQNNIQTNYVQEYSSRKAPVVRDLSDEAHAQPKSEEGSKPITIQLEDPVYTTVKKKLPFSFSADVYHKIATNDYSLLHPDRVPGFIKSEFSEIFRDCQSFYLEQKQTIEVTCDDCKTSPWRKICRSSKCPDLFEKFLQQFRRQLVQTSDSNILALSQRMSREEMPQNSHVKHLNKLKQIQFNIKTKKQRGAIVLTAKFQKILLSAKLKDQWSVAQFQLGALDEEDSLKPDGQSRHLVYQYLSNQMQKIYAVYESISDFPLGLLLVMIWMHLMNLFERMCQCDKPFDMSGGPSYGLMPPMFRDMWMRPDFLEIYKHNLCQTCAVVRLDIS